MSHCPTHINSGQLSVAGGRNRPRMNADFADKPLKLRVFRASIIVQFSKNNSGHKWPRIKHKRINQTSKAALSRYGRLGGIVSIVSIWQGWRGCLAG